VLGLLLVAGGPGLATALEPAAPAAVLVALGDGLGVASGFDAASSSEHRLSYCWRSDSLSSAEYDVRVVHDESVLASPGMAAILFSIQSRIVARLVMIFWSSSPIP
jgi:hypothetical protein